MGVICESDDERKQKNKNKFPKTKKNMLNEVNQIENISNIKSDSCISEETENESTEKKCTKKYSLKTNNISDPIELEINDYTQQINELESEAINLEEQSCNEDIPKEEKEFLLNQYKAKKEKIRAFRLLRDKLLKKQRLINKMENLKNDQKIEKEIKEEYVKGNEIYENIIKDDADDQQARSKFELNEEKAKKVRKDREGFLSKAIGDYENDEEVNNKIIKIKGQKKDETNLSSADLVLQSSENN